MTLPFKLDYAVLCDHIRREDNGKLILIGVYGTSILMGEIPSVIALSLALRITPTQLGSHSLDFRVLLDADEVANGGAEINVENLDSAFVNLGAVPLQIQKEGILRFEMRKKGTRWSLLTEIGVSRRPA